MLIREGSVIAREVFVVEGFQGSHCGVSPMGSAHLAYSLFEASDETNIGPILSSRELFQRFVVFLGGTPGIITGCRFHHEGKLELLECHVGELIEAHSV